jgi:hypothetical protein
MRNPRQSWCALALPLVLALFGGCAPNGGTSASPDQAAAAGDPALDEIQRSVELGLPIRLLPADFGTPEYVPPRGTCADILRDPKKPEVELRLRQQYTRRDQWQTGDTTVTTRYAEGVYGVSPAAAYELEPGDLLRVNCGRQSVTAVLSPISFLPSDDLPDHGASVRGEPGARFRAIAEAAHAAQRM